MNVAEHRNGIRSIEVQLLSVKDDDGNELNNYYGRKPTHKDDDGKDRPVILNLIEGEAHRLVTAKRAIAVDDIKPKKKRTAAPSNKRAAPTNNK